MSQNTFANVFKLNVISANAPYKGRTNVYEPVNKSHICPKSGTIWKHRPQTFLKLSDNTGFTRMFSTSDEEIENFNQENRGKL